MTKVSETTTTVFDVPVAENGTVLFVPLNRLKKSPRNARKTPHSGAHIEALAGSIAAKGMLQNLVVEPETNADGEATGSYFVTIGEGRRLAQLLRVKRKQIKKTAAIRCVLDTENDASEISLDENVTREAMHPADQFERFRELSDNKGWGAEEIAARFGVSAHVVKQRLRLGGVSPKLMEVYRAGDLSLDQLMAFAITEDHERQEQVYENLSYNREPWTIRRDLTKAHVQATDRRAIFVGSDAYAEAGGTIIRDLFTEDRGGYFEDAVLLDRLAIEKLEGIAAQVQETEGWKWASAHIDFPHAHGLRRVWPLSVDLSADDESARAAAQEEYDRLTSEYEGADELPDEVDRRCGELEAEIERIDEKRRAYDASEIARAGVFLSLSHDGTVRIERGFIRAEDELPEQEGGQDAATENEEIDRGEEGDEDANAHDGDDECGDAGKPLSDALIRDLTAHRTLGLRLALGEQPNMALIAVVHALAAQTFYREGEVSCLELRLTSAYLATHADGIEDTSAAKALADRHAGWASDMPRDVGKLWAFVAGLDHASLMALLAHCASLTVNTVMLPWERKPNVRATTSRLADAVTLDMTAHWTPTVKNYLGRITKAHILASVREGAGADAAERIAGMKKPDMAQAAERLLAGTGWLPTVLRTEGLARPDDERQADAHLQAAE